MSPLTEKSYRLLEILSEETDLSQRELAERSGLSLGMVNLVLKRLLKTGYIKAANLNRNKMAYILTSKGLGEKIVRSYHYFLRATRTFQESQSRIERMAENLFQEGRRRFAVIGEGDIVRLVEMGLEKKAPYPITVRRAGERETLTSADEVILDCRLREDGQAVGISVLEEILNPPAPRNGGRKKSMAPLSAT